MGAPDWRSIPHMMALAEAAGTNGIVYDQRKFDLLWTEVAGSGVPLVDPVFRFMCAILVQEGTGSFNTSMENPAAGGAGVEANWGKDIRRAVALVVGKLALYPQAMGQGFQTLAQQVRSPGWGANSRRSDGGPIEWVNWSTAILRPDGDIDTGCYALHASWWLGVRSHYVNFGGSLPLLSATALALDERAPRVRLTMRYVDSDVSAASNWNAQSAEPAVVVASLEVVNIAEIQPAPQPIPIRDAAGRQLCIGWLDGDYTVVKLRPLAEALGLQVGWDPEQQAVTLRWPGSV